ncbi:MAG: DUF2382 domain-containing protein [Crinalium sp.]
MTLVKLTELDNDYREIAGGEDITNFDVYSDNNNEKVGSIKDILVDEEGHFRYLIVDLGFLIFGKKVLLPIGRSRISYGEKRVYAIGMTREQAEKLPEFSENQKVDYDYEESVRGLYRPQAMGATATSAQPTAGTFDRNTYNYQQEQSLYGLNEQNHQNLRLYEERLIANKKRMKTGEVTVGKHVETETRSVSVPIEKERVVIERTTPVEGSTVVTKGEANFTEGEVARIEVYEETPDIQKEAFVREEVRVRKEVDHDTVNAKETIRREELDVNTQGTPVLDNRPNVSSSDLI